MGVGEKHELSETERTRQRRLRRLGILILLAGLAAAAMVYRRAASDDEAERLFQAGTLVSGNARRYENEMKNVGGQSNVLAAELRDWFGSFWHGRKLAGTLAVLSLGGSLVCFLLAHLMPFAPPGEDPARGPDDPHR